MISSNHTSIISDTDEVRIASERAVSELRYGRPVVVMDGGDRFAVLSLDAASPDMFYRFAKFSSGRHQLFVTRERATRLGLDAPQGALLRLEDHSYESTAAIAYSLAAEELPQAIGAPTSLATLETLARTALLLPLFVVKKLETSDDQFSRCLAFPVEALKSVASAQTEFSIVARTRVPLKDVAEAEFVVFRGGVAQRDQIAIVVGAPDLSRPVPVRIHSSCITGDLFGSLKCDCGDQLREGIQLIEQRGGGMLLYLDQEGRGTGIASKMRAYGYQAQGLDTVDADATLGFGEDGRRYEAAIAMLQNLGVTSVELLTNNPRKIAALEDAGFEVKRRTPVFGLVTEQNRGYLQTKARRSGHMIDMASLGFPAE